MATNSPNQADLLGELEAWYQERCNGDWEHQGGFSITTVDNPGWSITATLNGDPPWENSTDGKIFGGMEDEDALTIWYFEADNVLRAFCPPGELKAGLAKVLSLLKPGG